MSKLKVLDCTLRDGGFVNDWNFGHEQIINISKRLIASNIEILELGMLNDSREFDINRSITPHSKYFNDIFSQHIKNPEVMTVGMVILGECDISNVGECSESILDGIRVVFKKDYVDEGIEYAKRVIEKGYQLFVQPASITDYSYEELVSMLKKVSELNPYAVYIVDTYGLVDKDKLIDYYRVFAEILPEEINIGYHAHNNFNIAYSNCIELIEINNDKRNLILDSSVYGMGKNAGNTNTELLCTYLNENYDSKYNMDVIIEIIYYEIKKIKEKYSWGYELKHYISAFNKCHPKYVDFLNEKNTLTIEGMNTILSRIDQDIKTTFVKEHITELYSAYFDGDVNDDSVVLDLKENFKNKELVVICPGRSSYDEKDKISKYVSEDDKIVVCLNHFSKHYSPDYVLFSNNKRLSQMYYQLVDVKEDIKIITSSNISTDVYDTDFIISFNKFKCQNEKIITNSAIMFLNLCVEMGIEDITFAGLDGYTENSNANYETDFVEYKQEYSSEELNKMIQCELDKFTDKININYLTKTVYR